MRTRTCRSAEDGDSQAKHGPGAGRVVRADNCTGRTGRIARRGVTVMRTVGNTDRKVGALN